MTDSNNYKMMIIDRKLIGLLSSDVFFLLTSYINAIRRFFSRQYSTFFEAISSHYVNFYFSSVSVFLLLSVLFFLSLSLSLSLAFLVLFFLYSISYTEVKPESQSGSDN